MSARVPVFDRAAFAPKLSPVLRWYREIRDAHMDHAHNIAMEAEAAKRNRGFSEALS